MDNDGLDRADYTIISIFLIVIVGLPFLLGTLLGQHLGSGNSYLKGYCSALNAEVLDTGKGGEDACVDSQGRVIKPQSTTAN